MKGSDAARQLKAIAALVAGRQTVTLEEIEQLLHLGLGQPLEDKSDLSAVRSAAGRRGGERSVEVRREAFGSASPPKQNLEAKAEAKLEANSKQNPEAKPAWDAPPSSSPLHPPSSPTPENSLLSTSSKTVQVVREAVEDEDGARSKTLEAKVSCPADLELTPDQRGTLLTGLIGAAHIDAITFEWRAKYAGDESDKRTLGAWRRGLVTTIRSKWTDRRTRVLADPEDSSTVRRPPPIIQRDYKPRELGEIPLDVVAAMAPRRAPAGPRRSHEETLEALRLADEQAASEAAGAKAVADG